MTLYEAVQVMQIVMGATLSVFIVIAAFVVVRMSNWEWKNRAKNQKGVS